MPQKRKRHTQVSGRSSPAERRARVLARRARLGNRAVCLAAERRAARRLRRGNGAGALADRLGERLAKPTVSEGKKSAAPAVNNNATAPAAKAPAAPAAVNNKTAAAAPAANTTAARTANRTAATGAANRTASAKPAATASAAGTAGDAELMPMPTVTGKFVAPKYKAATPEGAAAARQSAVEDFEDDADDLDGRIELESGVVYDPKRRAIIDDGGVIDADAFKAAKTARDAMALASEDAAPQKRDGDGREKRAPRTWAEEEEEDRVESAKANAEAAAEAAASKGQKTLPPTVRARLDALTGALRKAPGGGHGLQVLPDAPAGADGGKKARKEHRTIRKHVEDEDEEEEIEIDAKTGEVIRSTATGKAHAARIGDDDDDEGEGYGEDAADDPRRAKWEARRYQLAERGIAVPTWQSLLGALPPMEGVPGLERGARTPIEGAFKVLRAMTHDDEVRAMVAEGVAEALHPSRGARDDDDY